MPSPTSSTASLHDAGILHLTHTIHQFVSTSPKPHHRRLAHLFVGRNPRGGQWLHRSLHRLRVIESHNHRRVVDVLDATTIQLIEWLRMPRKFCALWVRVDHGAAGLRNHVASLRVNHNQRWNATYFEHAVELVLTIIAVWKRLPRHFTKIVCKFLLG